MFLVSWAVARSGAAARRSVGLVAHDGTPDEGGAGTGTDKCGAGNDASAEASVKRPGINGGIYDIIKLAA